MRDSYTLIIPTYNRPESLGRLLRYLRSQGAQFQIRILDSSRPAERAANRAAIASVGLRCVHAEYPEDMHPFDKFREGIASTETPICSLCADDDVPILSGVIPSVKWLVDHKDYSAAHGYYFQFGLNGRELRLANFTYYTPSMTEKEPLSRLHHLMRHYQALTYATYRTEILLKIFKIVRPVESILARELLSSALAVVMGKVARVPVIYHGRSLGPSSSYQNWHPLEWLLTDAQGLFGEYLSYRELLLRAVLEQGSNTRSAADAGRLLDLIHMQYLSRHMPDEAFDYMIEETLRGTAARDVFRSHAVSMGLIHAANRFVAVGAQGQPPRRPATAALAAAVDRAAPGLARRLRSALGRGRHSPPAPEAPAAQPSPPADVVLNTGIRDYRLTPAFVSPPSEYGVAIEEDARSHLVNALDAYHD
jgi:glycosyltransferase domain-containing protein